ncbi:MAG: adenylyltransferase/cytidyltransferase family protein [Elusimicrobiota bacterium]
MAKVLKREELIEKITELKKSGKRVVFANGCFDIIHVGHVRYLRGAKKAGDILVVGINSDKSVRKLKGKGRPILSGHDRAMLVSAMEMVDYVSLFDELTAEELLKKIKPHVHAKGKDYKKSNVPERHLIGKYIEEIAIVGDKKNHSTRDILKDIKRKG